MKIRNKCQGPLVIADAKLRLAPGEVVEVATVTPQTQGALERQFVEKVGDDAPIGAPEPTEPTPDQPVEYQRLSAAEAIEYIDDEEDATKLEAILATEKRKTVLDALGRKLDEVKPGGTD